MTTELPVEKKVRNENAVMADFEQRVKTELEAPHKWNNAWGEFFRVPGGVPQEYNERIEYIEAELLKLPHQDLQKMNTATPIKDDLGKDHRRRKAKEFYEEVI